MINNSKKEVVSIDVPSGTNIDKGAKDVKLCVESEMNISLMLPKEGLRNYTKKHFLGGRFLPASIIKKYNLDVPHFEGSVFKIYQYFAFQQLFIVNRKDTIHTLNCRKNRVYIVKGL
ncbi:hypothetical protein [Plasmodium yoelii yoelii]|uniref:YjeF N-terminal domain-containing protein n=1 Tax=Plasmodium yoelii yoelii TaxID=73239 RepID=Q7RDA4_PLAYO|nr:hypothetical protein [Plasmodium yoelii yoelii]